MSSFWSVRSTFLPKPFDPVDRRMSETEIHGLEGMLPADDGSANGCLERTVANCNGDQIMNNTTVI